jgi:putative transposase
MSFIRILIHCVWCTKSRAPVLAKEKRVEIIQYIKQSAREKNIFVDCINGYTDHLHALVSLGGKQNIADTMQQIKGGSSFWINNRTKLFSDKFEWADKYYAVSVSESQLDKVRNYIHNQEEHHKKTTFLQEYEEFMKKYGFDELG